MPIHKPDYYNELEYMLGPKPIESRALPENPSMDHSTYTEDKGFPNEKRKGTSPGQMPRDVREKMVDQNKAKFKEQTKDLSTQDIMALYARRSGRDMKDMYELIQRQVTRYKKYEWGEFNDEEMRDWLQDMYARSGIDSYNVQQRDM